MIAKALLALAMAISLMGTGVMAKEISPISASRLATVRVINQAQNSTGTGFFIGHLYVATCFHVVGVARLDGDKVNFAISDKVTVQMPSGEQVIGAVVSVPTQLDASPITSDFAIIKLSKAPSSKYNPVRLAQQSVRPDIGDDVIFSGYPLGVPGMVTHKGMVSGEDEGLPFIMIQAPINKGNSGGALLDGRSEVIGIVSNREGGISPALSALSTQIVEGSKSGSVKLMGVDPLRGTLDLIQTLDQYISTGIGYARRIGALEAYIRSRPEMVQ